MHGGDDEEHGGGELPVTPLGLDDEELSPRVGHSIVKLNTTCETILLPLFDLA